MRGTLTLALAVFFLAPFTANASVLYSQTTQASTTVGTGAGVPRIWLFATSTGQYPNAPPAWLLNDFDLVLESSVSQSVSLRLVRYNALGVYQTVATTSATTVNAKGIYNFSFASPIDLQNEVGTSTHFIGSRYFWYALIFDFSSGAIKPYGASPNYTNSYYYNDGGFDFNPYLVLRGIDSTSTTTRIISLDSPASGSITSTNNVQLQFTYYFNDSTHFDLLDRACVALTDTTNGVQYAPKCSFITTSGVNNASFTYNNLNSGALYSWYAYLTASSTTENRINSAPNTFFVVFNGLINGNASTTATSTAGTLSFFSGMLSQLYEYSPYAYIWDIRDQLNGMATGTPAFNVEVPQGFQDNVFDPLKTGVSALLWLSFLSYILYRVTHSDIV